LTSLNYYHLINTPPTFRAGVDKFGIKKIYSTKPRGEEWYINSDPNNDRRFHLGSHNLVKNEDGSFKVTSTEVRFGVYTSSGYDQNRIATLDQEQLTQKGFMQNPNDWKNVEITGYFKVNGFTNSVRNGPAHIELLSRGGVHTDEIPCEGTSYHSNLYETGRSKFEKELEFSAGYATKNPEKQDVTTPLKDKWIGIKAIFYNTENGSVKLEQWIDDGTDNTSIPGNKWHKTLEFTDTGKWQVNQNDCGGAFNTIITWGGPTAIFRWDNIDNMDIKFLSVREIQPPLS
jgi:hypothetical protein